jgi:hypothetical protein
MCTDLRELAPLFAGTSLVRKLSVQIGHCIRMGSSCAPCTAQYQKSRAGLTHPRVPGIQPSALIDCSALLRCWQPFRAKRYARLRIPFKA